MEFEYFYTKSVNGFIDIDDIGNCAIEAFDDLGQVYYLVIRTSYGSTRIMDYGPIIADCDTLPKSTHCTYKRIEYTDAKIKKAIDNFLNNPYASITQAREIDIDEALNNCKSIINYMKGEDSF